jgi:hypothetical protein
MDNMYEYVMRVKSQKTFIYVYNKAEYLSVKSVRRFAESHPVMIHCRNKAMNNIIIEFRRFDVEDCKIVRSDRLAPTRPLIKVLPSRSDPSAYQAVYEASPNSFPSMLVKQLRGDVWSHIPNFMLLS